ncbi:MAG: ribonuclease P protein component [Betaproteobacteria bacterium]
MVAGCCAPAEPRDASASLSEILRYPVTDPLVHARRLPKSSRLNDSKVFARLLQGRRRTGDCLEFAVSGIPGKIPRLGIVVGKKNLPRAVDRNALKRIVRETFRQQRNELVPCDMLVRLRLSLKGQVPAEWRRRVAVAAGNLLAGARR